MMLSVFFYGDGPAAQFEAGQKQGGTYCCVDFQILLTIIGLPSVLFWSDRSLYCKGKHGKKEVYATSIHIHVHVIYKCIKP